MPATANEKQVASSADHILTAAQQTRKEIEYSLRDLTRLEERYALGKKMEDWAPQRLAELTKARASAVRMYTSYHQLVRAGNEQLTLQREGVTIRQVTGTAYALVAAGKLAECFIAGAKVLRKFEALTKGSKIFAGAEGLKTALDIGKDGQEAARAVAAGKGKEAGEKGGQALLKLSSATRDFADIVDTVFALAGLSDSKPDGSMKSAADVMVKMMKATKSLLLACREIEQSSMFRAGATKAAMKASADQFVGGMESLGIIGNIIEALVAIVNAIEQFQEANKLAEVSTTQEAYNVKIGGSALTTKQIMMLRVAVGAETGKTDLNSIRKSITSLESAKAVTRELNESLSELEAKYTHAQTHVTGFSAAYARRLEWLSKYYATAQVQLPQLMKSYEAAVKEQRAGGAGWRGAIGFLPERMNTELGVLVNAMTRAHIRLYC